MLTYISVAVVHGCHVIEWLGQYKINLPHTAILSTVIVMYVCKLIVQCNCFSHYTNDKAQRHYWWSQITPS